MTVDSATIFAGPDLTQPQTEYAALAWLALKLHLPAHPFDGPFHNRQP